MSKVLEKLFYKRLYSFLQKEKILYELQYEFRSNRSTSQAITELVGNLLNETENDKLTLCVYLELSKAFNTIDHDILLKKLEHYRVRGVAFDWKTSYINGYKMKIKSIIGDQGDFTIGRGTPQGSCLGTLIFIIFCNDISKICETCKTIMFADDTSIYYSHKNIFKLYEKVQKDLTHLVDYFKAIKLSLNLRKTICMSFNIKGKHIDHIPKLEINNVQIERVEFTRFLGLIIDSRLNWNEHVNNSMAKITMNKFMINMSKNVLTKDIRRNVYCAHIQSHLLHSVYIWGTLTSKSNINKIQRLQNKYVRIIGLKNMSTQVNGIFKELGILKISDLVEVYLVKMGYGINKSLLPKGIMNLFEPKISASHNNMH